MGRQYISTATASNAHLSDILDISIAEKFTISVSSDGYANFWDNTQPENTNANDYVSKRFINKSGIHHSSVYENILPGNHLNVCVIAFACFDGSVRFLIYSNNDFSSLKELETPNQFQSGYWAPCFFKDPESKQDYFIVSRADGETEVYYLNFKDQESLHVSFEIAGVLSSGGAKYFPNSVAVSEYGHKVAVGYINGDVLLYDLMSLKSIYTFYSTDLQAQTGSSSHSSTPRVLEFSPGGSLLAVARDNQSAGSITLYDVKYGENIGSLTAPSHSMKVKVGGFAHSGWILGLSFDEEGHMLASCGFDSCIRIWDIETKQREATINISPNDLDGFSSEDTMDSSVASCVRFIRRGVRGQLGDQNVGLCVSSFDRGMRWYREAGGS